MTFTVTTRRNALRDRRHLKKEPEDAWGQRTPPSPLDELWRVDWKKRGYPYCGVYVITPENLFPSKIGVSVSPQKRLIALQTSHWRLLQISQYRWAPCVSDAMRVEQEAHKILRENDKALLGEWFDIRASAAIEAVDWAGLSLGIQLRKDAPDERVQQDIEHWHRVISIQSDALASDHREMAFYQRPALGWADADKGKYGEGHLFYHSRAERDDP